ncbi:hypothetical protein S40285_04042 [Stachybotrys chlorohalonatus IBT 40285]|uniref:Uncharacterized protein n=1 Tax=Stachybotrys chlorohalonatus (strain IBT 40285) TaxID=1283841 RepID=A0A084R0A9_STAC4|nr:hypothetical protein S40285_04042 [Stachybotrys chlorohalonata IBT 40285]
MSECNPYYEDAAWSYYRYEPSVAANIAFVALFAVTTAVHIVQIWRSKAWYLSALVVGGLAEVIGYVGRVLGAMEDPGCWTLGPFVMQACLILVGPAFMAASIYMILGRIILLTEGEHHALIKRRWLTKLFVTGDVISLLTQSAGAGIMPISADMMEIGEYIVIVGLFVQIAFFGGFLVVASVFHWRMRKAPTAKSTEPAVRWQAYLSTLYVSGILIWVRSLFRAIEYIDGNDGPLMRDEIYVFTLDGMLILIVMVYMNWFHPSEIGLLLRGEQPFQNGFQLLLPRRAKRQQDALESTSSDNEMVSRPFYNK